VKVGGWEVVSSHMVWRGSENARTVFMLPCIYSSYSIGWRTRNATQALEVETGCMPSPVYKISGIHSGKPHDMSHLTYRSCDL